MRKYAIIAAAGRGERMGAETPKQFVPIGGLPVLMRTVRAFHKADGTVEIVVVLPKGEPRRWESLCHEYDFTVPHQVTEGGDTRFHSVGCGLKLIPDGERCVVAVHDGVRPFVSAGLIARCFSEAALWGSAVPVVSVVDTLRKVSAEGGSFVARRDEYRLVQTPQTFVADILKQAYAQEYNPLFTDEASAVEGLGLNVRLVDGERDNVKLTTPSDLRLAEFLCRESD